jgi:hypothetical protein
MTVVVSINLQMGLRIELVRSLDTTILTEAGLEAARIYLSRALIARQFHVAKA